MPPPSPSYISTEIQYHTISSFKFISGTTTKDLVVAYRIFPPSKPSSTQAKPTILIPTCYSGRINDTLTFTQLPNDALSSYTVVVAAMLGNGESSSPSNHAQFPGVDELRYEDVIHAHHDLLTKRLGVTELEAVVGFSMGGQQAYHWAVIYPSFVKRIVVICSSARTTPHNYAFLEGPINAVLNSSHYKAWKAAKQKAGLPTATGYGEDTAGVVPADGLRALGRAYAAWLTSAEWFRRHLWGEGSLEAWLKKGEKDAQLWNADDLIIKARMWQKGNIGITATGGVTQLGWQKEGDDALIAALKGIEAEVLLLPCRSDQYFTPEESEFEVGHLRKGRLRVVESCWGHIAGGGANLEDTRFMNGAIADFMSGR